MLLQQLVSRGILVHKVGLLRDATLAHSQMELFVVNATISPILVFKWYVRCCSDQFLVLYLICVTLSGNLPKKGGLSDGDRGAQRP